MKGGYRHIDELAHIGMERYIPDKGWGYSVIRRTWDDYCKYEVCPFFDNQIATDMSRDVIMCRDLREVGQAIEDIMKGGEENE